MKIPAAGFRLDFVHLATRASAPPRWRQILVGFLVLSLLSVVQAASTPTPAQAAPVVGFDPGNIISDSMMYDSGTMNAATVQDFLNVKGASCNPASGKTCIKAYRETTPTRAADALCTRGYQGAANESAASIIAKASVACGINPQVLLVTLQKEQGLITSTTGKSAATYSRALGFGCPDNAGGWCDPQYAGFANQVYSAARQFKRYAANPNNYSYRAGRVNTIQWHPNAACGSSQVYIANQATAGLYNYTPYRPNQAALNAGYGTGDGCSSYGNRNFYLYFTQWFGSTSQRAPVGSIDVVRAVDSSTVQVAGWAFDPDVSTSVDVHFYVDGVGARATTAKNSRPDVAQAFNRGDKHGYDVRLPVSSGRHSVCIYAIDGNGGPNVLLGCRDVTVTNRTPIGAFDVARAVGPNSIQVAGWAFDPDSAGSSDVHIYVDGKGVLATTAKNYRPDVGAAYNRGTANGFDVRVAAGPGAHNVCAYAIDTAGGTNILLGCKSVTVINRAPIGAFDVARAAGPNSIQVAGWAFDPDSAGSSDVHIYVDGKGVLATTAKNYRPDVGAAYNRGTANGFDVRVAAGPGAHNVCAYAIDTAGGTNILLGCKSVTLTNRVPVGALDVVAGTGPGKMQVRGWAFDPDTASSINVQVSIDGAAPQAIAANTHRPDVAAAYGITATHGFDSAIPVPGGAHSVCVTAVDSSGGTATRLGCRNVTVANTPATGALESTTATAAAPGGIESSIMVTGWAWDYDTTTPVPVRVLIDDVPATTATANLTHTAVAEVAGSNIGVQATATAEPGIHTVCLEAYDSQSQTYTSLGCEEGIEVPNTIPVGSLDTLAAIDATATMPAGIQAVGWALDHDTDDPVAVQFFIDDVQVAELYVDGTSTSSTDFLADQSRPDLEPVLQSGDLHGFDVVLPSTPGTHQVCVYAVDASQDAIQLIGDQCSTVTVP